jgi:threonine synthase
MDIQVASNFERYLYFLYKENPLKVREAIEEFSKTGRLKFSPEERNIVASDFLSQSVDRQETLDTISSFYEETGYLLDPHTAVGVKAAQDHRGCNLPLICLATAHPAKFEEAVITATGLPSERPASLAGIEKLPSRCEVLDADLAEIRKFIEGLAL